MCELLLPLAKNMELTHRMHTSVFYLAVNKLITDDAQNIYFIAEHSGFIKYPFK